MATFTSALAAVYKKLVQMLSRSGVTVNGTAELPRVEIHSVVEDAPRTKDNAVRTITCTVECVTDTKVADICNLLEGNVERLFSGSSVDMTGYHVIDIVPGQIRLFDEQEAQDSTRMYYRMLQDVTIWVEKQ